MEKIGYYEERNHWKEFDIKVSNEHAKMIVKKLARHFKLRIYYIYFHGRNDTGTAWNSGNMRLSQNPSVGVICHEVNHFLCWKKYGKVRHGTKRWCRQLQIIINYCRKKDFWKSEYERRTTPKLKIEPSKKEIRLRKIGKLEVSVKRHKTKIKRCTTLVKKAERRISALKRFV